MNNLYLYILMRTDLPSMGAGRAAAQASHAANAFIHKFGDITQVKEWAGQTSQGFGTAIVLGITDMTSLVLKVNDATRKNFAADTIVDPDYAITISSEIIPFIDKSIVGKNISLEKIQSDNKKYILHRSEITCGYIFGDKDELKELVGDLPLYS